MKDLLGTLDKVAELKKQLPVLSELKHKGSAFCKQLLFNHIDSTDLETALNVLVDTGIQIVDEVFNFIL